MAARYDDDSARGPGYGILTFSEVLVPEAPWSIALQRARDHNFATGHGAAGWTGETFFIPLEGEVDANGNLRLFLLPGLVDALDPQEQYRLILKGGDGESLTSRLKVEAVNYSGNAGLGVKAGPEDQQSEPVNTEPAAQKPAEATEAQPGPEPEKLDMPQQAPLPQKGRKLWRLLLLLLLIIVCLLWFVFDPRKKEEASDPDQAGSGQANPAQAGGAKSEKAPLTVQQRVSQFFASPDKTAGAAMELARQLAPSSAADQDAIYRLYYFAANADNGEGMVKYGQCLDPALPVWGSIEKDGALAWREYEKAARLNTPGADQAQENLRKWLESQSGSGNGQAKKWLDEITH